MSTALLEAAGLAEKHMEREASLNRHKDLRDGRKDRINRHRHRDSDRHGETVQAQRQRHKERERERPTHTTTVIVSGSWKLWSRKAAPRRVPESGTS